MVIVPSAEQQEIIDCAIAGKDIVVDAVAGSGKTTTILSIARAHKKQILQVTFNSQLKIEVRDKIKTEGLTNINVHTYHSLATTFYDSTCWNDGKMLRLIEGDKAAKAGKVYHPEVIIIDEAQDMTLLYYRMINKFMRDFCKDGSVPQLIVMGDRYQSVYAFMQADSRFLTLANDVWKREFTLMTLCESYRLTKPMSWFVNNTMVKQQRIVSNKIGSKVDFYISDPYQHRYLHELIIRIKTGSLNPDDIFILCASLKSTSSPARHIENKLVEAGIKVYVPISDEGKVDDDVTRGKVVFATFPSSKGRERKIVIVLGFDNSYFQYFAKNDNPIICPSTLYVAATRAKERLILVGSSNADFLPFLNMHHEKKHLSENVNMFESKNLLTGNSYPTTFKNGVVKKTNPTELVKFLQQDVINILDPLVQKLFVGRKEGEETGGVAIPSKIKTGRSQSEDVSDINGIVIPIMWEKTSSTTLHKYLVEYIANNKPKAILRRAISNVKFPCETTSEYLHLCNVYQSLVDGYIGRIAQIKKYEWMTEEMLTACHAHLDTFVSKEDIEFEVSVSTELVTPFGPVMINGRIDAVSDNTLWEFKCVDTLTLEHLLQVIIYAWIWGKGASTRYKILNIRSGYVLEMKWNEEVAKNIIDILIQNKWGDKTVVSDEDFIASTAASAHRPAEQTESQV